MSRVLKENAECENVFRVFLSAKADVSDFILGKNKIFYFKKNHCYFPVFYYNDYNLQYRRCAGLF